MNIDLKDDQRIPSGFFDNPLPLVRILYEAEQPIIFITRTRQGQEMLAYLASETMDDQFVIAAPMTAGSLRKLESGSIGVREALTSSWMWLLKAGHTADEVDAWSVSEAEIPEDHLPRPGTPLLPNHQVAFSARAIGDGIVLGEVPCSVISFVADAARSSLKTILDHVLAAKSEGRPSDARRALYDLPVRQIRFASFEIGLAAPDEDLFQNENIAVAVAQLERGLAWAEKDVEHAGLGSDVSAEAEAILRATLALTPPTTGAITEIEIGGFWFQGKTYHLSRDSRSRISKRLRSLHTEKIVVFTGRIGEFDDDNLSFTLRDVEGKPDQRGTFPEELFEDMRQYYVATCRVVISGVVRAGKLRVTAVVNPTDGNPTDTVTGDTND